MKKVIFLTILISSMLPADVTIETVKEPGPVIAAGDRENTAVKKTSSGKEPSGKVKAAKKPEAAKQSTPEKKAEEEPGTTAAASVTTEKKAEEEPGTTAAAPVTSKKKAEEPGVTAAAPVTPESGSTLEHGLVGFTWTHSSGTPTYQVQVSNDPSFTSPVIKIATTAASYVTETKLASGTYYWRVKEMSDREQANAWSPTGSFTVPVPLNTMVDTFINDGIVSTNSATVSLALSAESENGIAAYAIAESPEIPDTGEPQWVAVTPEKEYASIVPYTLSSGEGMKTLSVWFKDTAGKVSAKKSVTITFDIAPPHTTITSHPDDLVDSTAASFEFTSTKPGAKFRCSLDEGVFEACTSPASYAGLAKGRHTFAVSAIDAAGNADPTPAQHAWTVNSPVRNTTPQRFINRGASITDRDTVRLSISANAVRTENIIGYYVSEDPDVPAVSDPRWKTLRAVKSFSRDIEYTMSEGIGKKVLYVWFKDSDGNVSDVQSDTIRRIDSKYLIVVFVLLQLFILL